MNRTIENNPTELASSVQAPMPAGSWRLGGKRVAMVTFSPYPDDPRPRRAAGALVREGMTVDLICIGGESAPKREVVDGIDVLRLSIKNRRGGKLTYAWQYGTFIFISSVIFALRSLTRRYDLVYVHNMPDILVLSSLIPKALGAKVVLDLHDPMPELMMTIYNLEEDSRSVRLISRIEKWSIARANLVITVNLACKHIFAARSCPAEKIGVVMNAPDSDIFPFRAAEPSGRTKRDPNKRFVIMYHGSLVERNGLDLAVEALAQVRESVPTAELRVYGHNSPYLERCMDIAHKKGLDDAVRFLGPKRLEDLVHEIEDCDVGVIPNQRNSFTDINTPTRIFEYLAVGKPVIAPSTAGITEYFSEESLLFFESGNAADLAQQIEYVFSHPMEVDEIARKGQEVFLAHTWEQERETLLGRVSGILNKKQSARA
jgi:glycosyltransferase involved in cell wall biosynthesis